MIGFPNETYQQILDTEENVRNTIDRVIELKDNEKLNSLFTKKSFFLHNSKTSYI
mgnify:CR=1 FL=1